MLKTAFIQDGKGVKVHNNNNNNNNNNNSNLYLHCKIINLNTRYLADNYTQHNHYSSIINPNQVSETFPRPYTVQSARPP